MARRAAEGFLRHHRRPVAPIARTDHRDRRRRLEYVPFAALILRQLLAPGGRQDRLFGLRAARGLCLRAVCRPSGDDPLIEGCSASPEPEPHLPRRRRLPAMDRAPLFPVNRSERANGCIAPSAGSATSPGPNIPIIAPRRRSRAACRMPVPGRDPMPSGCLSLGVACPLWRRDRRPDQGGDPPPARRALQRRGAHARSGAAARLHAVGRRHTPAVRGLARREGSNLVLEMSADDDLFEGEAVQRRLDAVARSLGAAPVVRRSRKRRAASG